MLPDVVAQDREVAIGDGAILVGRRGHGELATSVEDKPGPAGTEALDPGIVEGGLEGVEGAEGRIDGAGQGTGRCFAAAGGHDLPEQRMVDMATTIVADGGANVLRHLVEAAYDFLNGKIG